MSKVKATVHGAISIVSAIASGKGAALGITPKVEVIMESIPGSGISIKSGSQSLSSRLITRTIEKIVSK
ncbi:MAG: shikimate kinase, partial [Nitrososphaerota archaeon]|nr:shikimate kinase [Nitrososphaerota archaeon]